MAHKIYLAKLKRTLPPNDRRPTCVYKIGITADTDAMKRLTYNRSDEPHPIIRYFPDIKVMKAIYVDTEEDALRAENKLMETIRGDERWFHNWYEPDQISGITEMRRWDYDEIQRIFGLMDDKDFLLS